MNKSDVARATRHRNSSAVCQVALATTLPTQGDQPGGKTPYPGGGAPNDLPRYAAPGYIGSEHLIAQSLPIHHSPQTSRQMATALPSVGYAGFVGTRGIGCMVARVVAGRLVLPPRVEQVALPTANAHHRPIEGHKSSMVSSYSSLAGAICEECAGVASTINPAPMPSVAAPKYVSSPDDDIFDLEALERSLADSPTSSTPSSLPDALIDYLTSPGYATHVGPVSTLPAQYITAGPTGMSAWWNAPGATVGAHFANFRAQRTVRVEQTLDVPPAAPSVDAHVDDFTAIRSIGQLASPMIYDPIFYGCFDERSPSWSPPSIPPPNVFDIHHTMEQWDDGMYLAPSSPSSSSSSSSSFLYPQPELAYPIFEGGVSQRS